MTCVLCKSGMYQIAEKIAKQENALAIIDGSSVGQVASQTLPNILATRYSTTMPVLSPLIGLDKEEISEIAEKIGTFPIFHASQIVVVKLHQNIQRPTQYLKKF